MGIFREAAAALIPGYTGAAANVKRVAAQRGETPGQESLDRTADGDSGDTGGFGQDAGRVLKRLGRRMAQKRY